MGITNLLFGWSSNVLTSPTLYKAMAFIAETDFSPLLVCPIFVFFCPRISFFFHCFDEKLLLSLIFWFFIQLTWDDCELQWKWFEYSYPSNPYSMRRSYCGDLFHFVGVSNIVSWSGFLLTTTLPFTFRRNRSSILFQLDDTADSCKTCTNQCSNLSTRLSCVFVQFYDLRMFSGYHVHLALRLTYDYFVVDSRDEISQICCNSGWHNDCISQLIKLLIDQQQVYQVGLFGLNFRNMAFSQVDWPRKFHLAFSWFCFKSAGFKKFI